MDTGKDFYGTDSACLYMIVGTEMTPWSTMATGRIANSEASMCLPSLNGEGVSLLAIARLNLFVTVV